MATYLARAAIRTCSCYTRGTARFVSNSTADGGVRLNRLMAMKGICSRREADEFIKMGCVEVDGRPAILGEVINEDKVRRSRVLLDIRVFESC